MIWVLFLAGVVIAFLGTGLSIRVSLRGRVLDVPNSRSSHSSPVPRIGGLGILLGFYLCIAAYARLGRFGFGKYWPFARDIWVILFAGAAMALTGLMDDLRHFESRTKFIMQFAVSAFVVALGIRLESFALPSVRPFSLSMLAYPITILWLIGFSNVFNFMDGINGIAAGTGVVYGMFFFIFSRMLGNPDLAMIALMLSGCSLGFMFHNFPEARTFMGDGGSLFLGMMFSLLVVRIAQLSPHPSTIIAELLLCSVYLYDSSFTILRRLLHRENIFRAHRSHLYQRLVIAGRSHAMITNLYLVLHILMGSLALLYAFYSEALRWWILGLTSGIFLIFTIAVYRIESAAIRFNKEGRDFGVRSISQ